MVRRTSIRTNGQIVKRRRIFTAFSLAFLCFLTPVLMLITDPIHVLVKYALRLRPGSYMYSVLKNEFEGPRLAIYLFNISNADRFMAGEDLKLKLEEVGPFVYQEYRWYENMELNNDSTEMTMTARYRSEFLREESVADPKDINMTVANLPMLSVAAVLSHNIFLRFTFNRLASQLKCKAITNLTLHDYFWGYKYPLLTISNKLLPGMVYYESFGLLDRFYDKETDYRIVVGATDEDRFRIKAVKKYRHLVQDGIHDISESELTFPDTYEGVGYPPELTPEVPINWFRIPICINLGLQYLHSKTMDYGGEGLVYTFSNSTFNKLPDRTTKDKLPKGLMDISPCYFGMPFVISKTYFLDADPKLLDFIEGFKPDKEKIVNQVIIDRRAAITFSTKLSLQLSVVLGDLSYNNEAARFSNTVVPILRMQVDQPEMPRSKMILFYLVYKILPWVFLVVEIVLAFIGSLLTIYAVRMMRNNWSLSNRRLSTETDSKQEIGYVDTQSAVPLVNK